MGFDIFLDITTFELRRLNIGGDDAEITDNYAVNLAMKWLVPEESGDVFLHPFFSDLPEEVVGIDPDSDILDWNNYSSNLTYSSFHYKPWMLTVEEIEDVEHLILYSLDYKLQELFEGFEFEVNPDITIEGDGFIRQLDGGVIADAGSGLTWAHLFDGGEVTPKVPAMTLPEWGFQPILLFQREDIS